MYGCGCAWITQTHIRTYTYWLTEKQATSYWQNIGCQSKACKMICLKISLRLQHAIIVEYICEHLSLLRTFFEKTKQSNGHRRARDYLNMNVERTKTDNSNVNWAWNRAIWSNYINTYTKRYWLHKWVTMKYINTSGHVKHRVLHKRCSWWTWTVSGCKYILITSFQWAFFLNESFIMCYTNKCGW